MFLQSFDGASLRILREQTPVRLIQLIDEQDGPISDARLREIALYAVDQFRECRSLKGHLVQPRAACAAHV